MIWRPALIALCVSATLLALTATIGQSDQNGSTVNLPLINDAAPPTPTVGPGLVFSDNFSDSSSGWPSDYTPDFQTGYLNGEYQMYMIPSGEGGFSVAPAVSPNLSKWGVSADVRYATANLGYYGLAFDIDLAGGTWFLLLVDPYSKEASLFAVSDGGSTAYLLSPWQSNGVILGGQATNHLTINRNGDLITALVNQSPVAEVDLPPGSGFTGLYNTVVNQGWVDARFDNYLLYSPGIVGQSRTQTRGSPMMRTGLWGGLLARR